MGNMNIPKILLIKKVPRGSMTYNLPVIRFLQHGKIKECIWERDQAHRLVELVSGLEHSSHSVILSNESRSNVYTGCIRERHSDGI